MIARCRFGEMTFQRLRQCLFQIASQWRHEAAKLCVTANLFFRFYRPDNHAQALQASIPTCFDADHTGSAHGAYA